MLQQISEDVLMDFESILDLFFEFFDSNGDQSRKRRFYEQPIKPAGTPYFCKVWGMLLEVKIHEKTIQKTDWILEGIFDGF